MKVFVDCDLAVKFAQWGLLTRLTAHLTKQGKADLYTVSTLKYRFKLAQPAKAVAMLGSIAAVGQLSSFVQACKPHISHNLAIAEALSGVPSIDVGEAALFAAAASYDSALVDTGDKKALRAVGALAATHPAQAALAGKLACLEQTLQYVVSRWGFDIVSNAVGTHASADIGTNACFAKGTPADTLQALQARVDDLAKDCALLAKQPFNWIP
jgi:hypothetical protein